MVKHTQTIRRLLAVHHWTFLWCKCITDFFVKHSGDGLLSVFNTRKKKLEAISDQQDEEMLSVVLMKVGKFILKILMKEGKLILKI